MNPILALIIANIIWGAAAPIFKFALTNVPPFTLAFMRFFFASFLFMPFIWKYRRELISINDWSKMLLASFFGITINISFFFLGLEKGTSINAPIIASSGPIFLFIGAVLFLHEKLKKRVFLGMLIAFSGTLLVVFSPLILGDGKPHNISEFRSNIFFIIATLGAILDPLIIKSVLKKVQPYVVLCVNFLFASLAFLPFMVLELNNWSFAKLNTAGVTGIVFGIFFSSALAYFLFYYGISKIAAQEVGLFAYIDPIIAILIAAPLLKEYPNLIFLFGSLSVFLGIFIAEGRVHYHPIHKIRSFVQQLEYVK